MKVKSILIIILTLGALSTWSCSDDEKADYSYEIEGVYSGQMNIYIPELVIDGEKIPGDDVDYTQSLTITRAGKNRINIEIKDVQFPVDDELISVGNIKINNIAVDISAGKAYYFVSAESDVLFSSPLSLRTIRTGGYVKDGRLTLEIGVLGRVRALEANYGAEYTFSGTR